MSRTTLGVRRRTRGRAALLFARPKLAPPWVALRAVPAPGRAGPPGGDAGRPAVPDAPWGQRELLLERLPDLAAPTLVVSGARDRFFPLRQARDTAGRLEEGRLRVIPACGHLPHVERPSEFAQALGRSLDEKGDL